jgi:hypothetical protein
MTVCNVELPERSPPAVKLPTPQPLQLPLTMRFWSVVVVPVIVTVPGKVAVMPALPIVMPVADVAPMVTFPVASTLLFESPLIDVPLKVRDAKATETLTESATKTMDETRAIDFLLKLVGVFTNEGTGGLGRLLYIPKS